MSHRMDVSGSSRPPRAQALFHERGREPVSLGYELLTLENAIQGVAALVDVQRLGGSDDYDIDQALAALMALVRTRVRDLRRVVRGSMPVSVFLARHNEALDPMEGDDPDVLLSTPSPAAPRRGRRR